MEIIQNDLLAEFLKMRTSQTEDSSKKEEKNYGEDDINLLKLVCQRFLEKESFEVGEIVKWKENLQNRKFPFPNQPAIVVAILNEPLVNKEDESGSPYFLENLDIILGVIDPDGTFLTFYYDSKRFERYVN